MGLLDRLFGYRKGQQNIVNESPAHVQNENVIHIFQFRDFIKELLNGKKYVAKSEYIDVIKTYAADIEFFDVLKKSGMFNDFCKKNGISVDLIEEIIHSYRNIEEIVEQHNEKFISYKMESEKDYLDTILNKVDPKIFLDDDQRRVVLTDEDYCLVIAGAGAGKTTTVAAKVKYLVDKQGIAPSQILVVSYTNKAVNELKERIQGELGIECPIATFHSTGNAILHKNSPEEKLNIVDQSKLYFVIRDYFRNSIMRNESAVNNLIMFFATYFDAPYEGGDLNSFFNNIAKANFSTLRSDLEDFKREVIDKRTKKLATIQNEVLRSHQEVYIANFLYLNNIDYEYEPIYKYNIEFSRKPYTPDFIINQGDKSAYIEHFGITESGENDRFSPEEIERYKKAVNDKVKMHQKHGTTLLYTFSAYKDGRFFLDHLKEKLESAGFELKQRSNKEVMEMLVAGEENRYIRKLINLLCRFISNFKVNAFQADDFNRMYYSTQNVRSRLFLSICNDCYLEYERWLKENKAVDFEDLINESARILCEVKEMKKKLDFKYIIVDEYQDISRQRFDLTKLFSEVTDAKIIAVGDDWQSIYAFSGSDITLFTKFAEKMGYAKLLKIVRTYRNSQEVIDIAGNFIQRNKEQITKKLLSPKHIEDPVLIYTYDGSRKLWDGHRKSGRNYELGHAIEMVITDLLKYKKYEGIEPGSILLLGRYGFDGDKLERTGLFEYVNRTNKVKSVKYPKLDITFMTAHSSKGLGYDDVIVINGKNETYGFPSKVEDDPVLSFVIKGDHSIDYAEERRLFYVAMTRTKNRVFFVAPEANPSEFLLELKRSYKNVKLLGKWNEAEQVSIDKKPCPLCGYPMQLKYKRAYGLRLYICTNEPEICGFMTNQYQAGKLAIQKCDKCQDGYLIVKQGSDKNFFLGCTNYKQNGTGCNKTVSKQMFYSMMGYTIEESSVTGNNLFEESERLKIDSVKTKQRETKTHKVLRQNEIKSQTENSSTNISNSSKDDYVEIVRANVKPVYYKGKDLNDVIFISLKALQNVSRVKFFGLTVLCAVLRGSEMKRLSVNNLDKLPEYGAYRDFSVDEVKTIVEWMISEHLILQTKGKYPVLHSTYEGLHYSETITENKLKKLFRILDSDFSKEYDEK